MKRIELTNKKEQALIDEVDFALVSKYKWHTTDAGYARAAPTKNNQVYMHRLILNLKSGDGIIADHINNNRLDNRRANLRTCTSKQNQMNKTKQRSKASSKYKGVSWNKAASKWIANIRINGQSKYLGVFENEGDAAIAYNKAATKFFGNFAQINIIEDSEKENHDLRV